MATHCKTCGTPIENRGSQAQYCSPECAPLKFRDPLKVRQTAVKYKYGLEWDEYLAMHEKAQGRCEICSKPLSLLSSSNTETAYVDHCHDTGQVRGLLCRVCNVALGALKDSRLHLQKAIDYLDKYDVDR